MFFYFSGNHETEFLFSCGFYKVGLMFINGFDAE